MNSNPQPLTELRRLFDQPAGTRTVAHECAHPDCSTITLGRDFCRKHRAPEQSNIEKPAARLAAN